MQYEYVKIWTRKHSVFCYFSGSFIVGEHTTKTERIHKMFIDDLRCYKNDLDMLNSDSVSTRNIIQ